MTTTKIERELLAVINAWCRAMTDADTSVARALRDEAYTLSLATGEILTRDQEMALLASPTYRVTRIKLIHCLPAPDGSVTVSLQLGVKSNDAHEETYISRIDFRRIGGEWRATKASIAKTDRPTKRMSEWSRRTLSWARTFLPNFHPTRRFYVPYKPNRDFALPRLSRAEFRNDSDLPVPPKSLWLGYDYLTYGKSHVDAMLSLLQTSQFSLEPGDRVLDFGCGAGRMIRHLRSLANLCEIWGTDISSEHILWCKRNMSPPFRFATTTKVPHLPFADGSFRLIYCGSVFTHIDDLADAWLLELRRLLAPDGRLYVTIHDNRTVELIESADGGHWLDWVRYRPAYRNFKSSFDVITVGREEASQVFYDRDYFCRMANQASMDVLSISPEAYFYQTAILLKPSHRPS